MYNKIRLKAHEIKYRNHKILLLTSSQLSKASGSYFSHHLPEVLLVAGGGVYDGEGGGMVGFYQAEASPGEANINLLPLNLVPALACLVYC